MKKNLKRYLAAVLAASMVMSSTGISSLGSSIDLGSNDQSAPTSEITSGADKDLTGSGSSESGDQASTDSDKDAGTSGKEDGDASIFDSENNAPADVTDETGGEGGSGDDGTEGGNESGGSENGGTGNNNTKPNKPADVTSGNENAAGGSNSAAGGTTPENPAEKPAGDSGNTGGGSSTPENNTGNNNTTPDKPADVTSGEENAAEGTNGVTGGTTPGNPAEKPAGDGGHTGGGSSTPENNADNNNAKPDKPADVTSGGENAAEGNNSVTGGTTPEKPQPETEKKPEVEIEETPEDEPEDELQSYILESITFPGEELISYTENADTAEAGTEDDKEEKGVMASLFSLFSADETVDESAETEEAEENNEDIRYYVERHINVGDDISAADLPDKITLKVRKADDDSFASPTNYSKDKSNNTKNITIDLDPEDWEIVSPATLSGSIDNLDTSGIETINDDGTITVSDVYAVYPEYLLIPDFDSMDLEENEGIMLYTDSLTADSDASTFEEYLAKNSAVMLTVGDVRPLAEGETEIDITIDSTSKQPDFDENYVEYSVEYGSGVLTLKSADVTYRITGSNDNIRIIFAEGVTTANIILEGVTIGTNSAATIDLSGLTNAEIAIAGMVSINNNGVYSGIHVPENTTLILGGNGNLSIIGGNLSAAIGGNMGDSNTGDVVINGGTIDATARSNAAAIGAAQNGESGNITINGGTVTATNAFGVAIGSTSASAGKKLTVDANAKVLAGAMQNMPGSTGPIGGLELDIDPDSLFVAYTDNQGELLINSNASGNTLLEGTFSNRL